MQTTQATVLLLLLSCISRCLQSATAQSVVDDDETGEKAPADVALKVTVLAVLLLLSAMFSGLGLGIMSLDLIGLEIVVAAGEDENATEKEKQNSDAARRIIPIRQKGNLLLTTLLLGNVSVNALTSILMADLTSGKWKPLLAVFCKAFPP